MFWLMLLIGFFVVNIITMAIFGEHVAGREDFETTACIFQTLIELGIVKMAIWICEHVVIV